ncbi:tau 95 subunit of transcription factor TFIIIC [Podospora pseudocomata]|uniref:Tau 95 subunit of transcription factor TFIIIC n=1 Tax=Podospora pseudocomata TaxID=2093779 RepID=A0ABR0GNS7_9PEZI|nr:tau 95 subunit of transcription factor TFIIIC [Podospora pseudocomata]
MDPETRKDEEQAPIYTIPSRRLGALEHPMIIKNLDKGIKTLGQNNAFQAILDSASPQISVPLYLRPDNPTARPLTSHNALTHNVVLKVTVPKRTGRKRKRGTDDPWEGEVLPPSDSSEVLSRDRLDHPAIIRRKLQDNPTTYTVTPVGIINNTHRYRGLADFQYSLSHSKFMNKFVSNVLPGDINKLKNFSLAPGIETGKDIDLIPPPYFTPMSLPFSYGYNQNPHTKELASGGSKLVPDGVDDNSDEDDEYARVVNVTARGPAAGYFIAQDEYPVPTAPKKQPDMTDPQIAAIINEMRAAMEERPIWTRRSMWNRLGAKFAELPKNGGLVRHCLQFAGYQFKGGPWRDALVKYGLDPRSDPKYRVYQTLIFKLHKTRIGSVGRSWQAVRRNEISVTNFGRYWRELGVGNGAPRMGGRVDEALLRTHVFDGESFSTDGKVWQVIDITDPLLKSLFEGAEVRQVCDNEVSGFYHRVLWSVAKAIMKTKMLAVRFNRELRDEDFSAALEAVRGPENGGDGGGGRSIGISLPDLNLSPEECEQLRGHKMRPGVKQGTKRDRWAEKKKKTHYRVRIPLKDVEEKEARKMIWLLTRHEKKSEDEGGVIDPALAGVGVEVVGGKESSASTADKEVQKVAEKPDGVMPSIEGAGEEEEDDDEGGVLQDILDDMEEDEEGSSTSDSEEEENEGEEEEESLDSEEDLEEDEEEDEEEEDEEFDSQQVDQNRGMAIPTSKKTVTFEDGLGVVQEKFDYDEMEEEGDYDEEEEGYGDGEEFGGYDEDEEGYYDNDEDGYLEEEYYDEGGVDRADEQQH